MSEYVILEVAAICFWASRSATLAFAESVWDPIRVE